MPRFTEGWNRRPPLKGPPSRVELHPEATVDLEAAGVVDPRDPEDDLPFGLAEPFEDCPFQELRVAVVHRSEAFEDLGDRLVELPFAGIPCQYRVPDRFKPCVLATSTLAHLIGRSKKAFPWLHRAGRDFYSRTRGRHL